MDDLEKQYKRADKIPDGALHNYFAIKPDELEQLRADAERGRRALLLALNHLSPVDLLVESGLYTEVEKIDTVTGIKYTEHKWTPAAHEFAKEMEVK